MAAIKALQQWCKIQCNGYRDVAIVNMTTSFRDGLAFCALIHKFRPDLINFESLSKDNVYDNNHLAFSVAEDHLGIPALLDAEDMVALSIPDRLSILTYVSQYYNYFNSRSSTGGVGGIKRPAEGSKEEPSEKKNLPVVAETHNPKGRAGDCSPLSVGSKNGRENCPPSLLLQKSSEKHAPAILKQQPAGEKRPPAARIPKLSRSPGRVSPSRVKTSPDTTAVEEKTVLVESSNKTGTLNSKCVVCGSHVHLVQRHLVDGKLYHRSCFKCCECSVPVKSRVSGAGQDRVTQFSSTYHAHSHPEGSPQAKSGLTPPGHASVLCTPVRAPSHPTDPGPTPQPWMDSAQRTQEARRKFFLSADSAPPSGTERRREPPAARSAGVSEAELEEEETRATIAKNLSEGNCNNNNKAYSCGLKAQTKLGNRCCSATVPGWRQERPERQETLISAAPEGAASLFCPSPTSPSPRSEGSLQPDEAVGAAGAGVPADLLLKRHVDPDAPAVEFTAGDCVTPVNNTANSSDDHVMLQAPPTPVSVFCPPRKRLDAGEAGFKNKAHTSALSPSDGTWAPSSSCTNPPSSSLPDPQQPRYRPGNPKDWLSIQPPPDISLSLNKSHKPRASPAQHLWQVSKGDGSETGAAPFGNSPASERIQLCRIPVEEITKELQEIESSLNDLEKEGIDLERRLRRCEEEGGGDMLMDPLMVDWFRLIQKKESYIRRESELVYIAKSQDLEELQPGVEGEIRRLMDTPEHLKSPAERQREVDLMKRLVEIVNDRNAIVDSLEQDRLREEEEDQQLVEMMKKLGLKTRKAKRTASLSKLFRRRSNKTSAED